jgi:hypothetical protein
MKPYIVERVASPARARGGNQIDLTVIALVAALIVAAKAIGLF